MSEDEEVLDDFSMRETVSPSEYMVGAYRAEQTKDWSLESRINPKNPPSIDGTTSWFKYEERIEDWLEVSPRYEQTRSGVEEQASWKRGKVQRTPRPRRSQG